MSWLLKLTLVLTVGFLPNDHQPEKYDEFYRLRKQNTHSYWKLTRIWLKSPLQCKSLKCHIWRKSSWTIESSTWALWPSWRDPFFSTLYSLKGCKASTNVMRRCVDRLGAEFSQLKSLPFELYATFTDIRSAMIHSCNQLVANNRLFLCVCKKSLFWDESRIMISPLKTLKLLKRQNSCDFSTFNTTFTEILWTMIHSCDKHQTISMSLQGWKSLF